ncbi:conserved hypothetical protein [Anaeromyxobacter sp. K]|uniref:DUF4388 domain-containing protein n=1 Tax=Anaeromyxobacter sp. (strain K) TaxID=447217 RepID=UPI00015F8252|nr:DUF4388 domain-containing protein [Anaeromyxobacter sp. K]ACG74912.1 conserved hypothetical protein [Anaeromyxobacter sp. K]
MAAAPGLGEGLTLLVDIDAHGRLVPQTDEVRRALADRAGRFVLLPSAPDLLLARRTPATGAAAARPRCLLAGDLDGFPLGDLMAFLHQSRLTGILTVSSGGVERSVAFQEGEVRGARSSAPGERLGEIAVRLGLVGEAQAREALRSGRPVGKALLDAGALSAADLWNCLHEQATVVFQAVLLAGRGTFVLMDEELPERAAAALTVSTQALLMDGARRMDELALFRARIPGPRARVRRRRPRRAAALQPPERALLELVDGSRTVAELAMAAHLDEFEATKLLYHLAEAGHVAVEADAAAEPAPEAARLAELAEAMNTLLREVTAAVPEAGRPALRAAVRGFLADGAAAWAPVWAHVGHADDGALDPGALAANVGALAPAAAARLHPSGDRARVLFEALRELLFFHLFAAGDRLERAAERALGASLRRGLARVEALLPSA